MSTPLPASLDPGTAAKTYSSLIISPALPPIPSKVVERARSGAFVDFKEFLLDNTLLVQRLQELGQAGAIPIASQPLISNSRMREVSDPLTWASCFLAYLAAKTGHDETRELAAYGMIVLQLARKHSGSGWLLYDRQFRQQQAAGASLSWVEINPSLMAATVLGQPAKRSSRPSHLCLAADHSREECALASLEPRRPTAGSQISTRPTSSSRNAFVLLHTDSVVTATATTMGTVPVHHAASSMCAWVVLPLATQRCGAQRPKQREGTGLLIPGLRGYHSSPPRLQKNRGSEPQPWARTRGPPHTTRQYTYGSILRDHTH